MLRYSASLCIQYDSVFSPFPAAMWREGMSWIRDSGFNAVEIILSDPELLDLRQLCQELEKTKLEVSTLATGQAMVMEGIYMTSASRHIREATYDRICRNIDLSRSLGRPNVTIGLIRGRGGEQGAEIEYEFLKRELNRVADYAAKYNVRLNLEPINRYECRLINSVSDAVHLIDDIGMPENVGILYDTFHSNIEDVNSIKAIQEYGYLFSNVHFADSNRCLPGEGHIHFPSIVKELECIGYEGYVALEVLNSPSAEHIQSNAAGILDALRGVT